MLFSRKKTRLFQLAKSAALAIRKEDVRLSAIHGAVLVRGGNVIGTGMNKYKFNRLANRNRFVQRGIGTYHAEIDCMCGGFLPETLDGADIYVIRIERENGKFCMSKPCEMCQTVMQSLGIRRCFYTIDEKNYGVVTL